MCNVLSLVCDASLRLLVVCVAKMEQITACLFSSSSRLKNQDELKHDSWCLKPLSKKLFLKADVFVCNGGARESALF